MENHTSRAKGAVLSQEQFAIAANLDGSFSFYLPDYPDGHLPVPQGALLLAAVAAKVDDEKWAAQMIDGLVRRMVEEGRVVEAENGMYDLPR
jgi:hypothetical protein